MKKLIYAIIVCLIIIVLGCLSFNREMKVLVKQGNESSVVERGKILKESRTDFPKVSPLVPINSWDGKMMIW